ncbi:Aste57867_2214 [Aphanomyces stellatus]|uniref:Aste57867_2214 protein n=1 Tax=Aphanomyces stellatus TaxID=120398 RepID=A0A485K9L9_9STRA|nr:hypothetical protein As57867_002209 [Aphanomyces stellatus]VFT79417.1 Aste57867_2214 [Aphanomyces stellatus]
MPKVHVHRVSSPPRRQHAVRFCAHSLFCTVGYVLNLSLIPFKAYMSEPFPWQVQPLSSFTLDLDATFDVFANTTIINLTSKYNQESVPPGIVFTKDTGANSYLLRFAIELPRDGDPRCVDYMHHFPGTIASVSVSVEPMQGAIFYSQGMVAFVCDYVGRNSSSRLTYPSYACQQDTFAGFRVAASCTWVVASTANNTYDIYHAAQLLVAPWVSWVNFGLRCGLFGYIARSMWYLYYRHYGPLLLNLRTLGLPNSHGSHSYIVQLGDPTWLILSHPFVSLFMLLDCFVNAMHGGAANSRTSQISDMGAFCLGCLYGSRTVWAAYMQMRHVSSWINHRQWEEYFEPLDPGLLALTASFYAGPLMYFFSRTPVVWVYQWLQASLIPETKRQYGVEGCPLILSFFMMMATVPMVHSYVNQAIHRKTHARSTFSMRNTPDKFASRHFSDWKHWLLFRWRRHGATKEGGTLYHLFDSNPRYRKFPLFSTRGSDCFVSCIDDDTGSIVLQVRLSLIYALNRQTTCPSLAIPTCPIDHPTFAVGKLGHSECDISKEAPPSAKCLHLGANHCQWMK